MTLPNHIFASLFCCMCRPCLRTQSREADRQATGEECGSRGSWLLPSRNCQWCENTVELYHRQQSRTDSPKLPNFQGQEDFSLRYLQAVQFSSPACSTRGTGIKESVPGPSRFGAHLTFPPQPPIHNMKVG